MNDRAVPISDELNARLIEKGRRLLFWMRLDNANLRRQLFNYSLITSTEPVEEDVTRSLTVDGWTRKVMFRSFAGLAGHEPDWLLIHSFLNEFERSIMSREHESGDLQETICREREQGPNKPGASLPTI